MSPATEAVVVPPRREAARPGKWSSTITVTIGMMASIMASTMVNVALADIMGAYGIGQDQVHWMSTGFLSAMTVCMLLNAWFVQNLGPRNTFLLANAVFVAASIFGQYVPGFGGMILARVLQGACAGLLQPLAMSVIFPAFPPEERGKAMGIFGMGVVLGPAIGPTFGGFIVDNADWRFVFTAALPLSVVASALGTRYLPGRAADSPRNPLSWTSFILVCLAIGTFLNAISNGQREGWDSPYIVGMFLTAAVAALTFFTVESRARTPLIQLRLFADRTFAISSLVGFMFGAGMFGSMYLLPLFAQTVAGFTASKAGWMLMVAGLALVPVFPFGGRLAQNMQPRYPIAAGMFLFGVSSWVLAGADLDTGFWALAGWAAFGRIGLGLVIPALNTTALRAVPPDLLPYGAGTLNFIRMLGGAIGVNTLAIVLELRTARHADLFAATQTPDNPVTRELLQGVVDLLARQGVGLADQVPLATAYLGQMILLRANGLAFQDGFMVLAGGFALATLSAFLLVRR